MEFLDNTVQYWHWIIFGIALVVAEIFLPSFFALWLGVSAILVGIAMTLFSLGFNAQLMLWGGLSIACLIAWFKLLGPLMKTRSTAGMAREALLGQQATVVHYDSESQRGEVFFTVPILGNEKWDMICEDPVIAGDKVKVQDIAGNRLIVKKS